MSSLILDGHRFQNTYNVKVSIIFSGMQGFPAHQDRRYYFSLDYNNIKTEAESK